MVPGAKLAAVLAAPVASGLIAAAAGIEGSLSPSADMIHDKPVTWLLAAALMISGSLIAWLVKKVFEVNAATIADRAQDRQVLVAMKDSLDGLVFALNKRPCALVESGAARVSLRQHAGQTENMMRAEDDSDTQGPKLQRGRSTPE